VLQRQQVLERLRRLLSTKGMRIYSCLYCHLLILGQCDTFSRSADAVFELSLRFADPFKISEKLSPAEKLEAERLMFLELTQG